MYQCRSVAFAALLAFFYFCSLNALVSGQEQPKVPVDVYYESLCPDSIRFVTKELAPSFNDGFKNFITVNFIPFGKASWNVNSQTNRTEFTCQHGPSECRGNRAQACALDEIEKNVPADDQQQKMVDIVSCAMSKRNLANAVPQCASEHQLSQEAVDRITDCSKSPKGDDLLVSHGKKTKSLKPPLSFVPTIVIKGEPNAQAYGDFVGVICNTIPSTASLRICRS